MNFYFYDLETSGFDPRSSRIMQFAGQRADKDLNPVGEPDNMLIKLTPDVLPDPEAVLVTGITPQATISDGIPEAEFVKYLTSQVFLPGTVVVGYNNVRFDDEFIRFTLWRNFADAYEWQWKDNCSRWDLLDVVRMTRALRPDGIKWPFAPDGEPSVRLEYMSGINKLAHENAHDALSDVKAAIGLARLVKNKQPKLFDYFLNLRDRKKIAVLVEAGEPVVYSSGRYPSQYEKTTIAVNIVKSSDGRGALMYDLRVDPDDFTLLNASELAAKWSQYGKDAAYFPVKRLTYNRCPVVAPLSVLDRQSAKRLQLDRALVAENLKKIRNAREFGEKLLAAVEIMDKNRQVQLSAYQQTVDGLLYDGFISSADKAKMNQLRSADNAELKKLDLKFNDERLNLLLPLYKARNFPEALNDDEKKSWENFRRIKLLSGGNASRAALFFKRLQQLSANPKLPPSDKYLLEELNLYGQSVLPNA